MLPAFYCFIFLDDTKVLIYDTVIKMHYKVPLAESPHNDFKKNCCFIKQQLLNY